MSNLTFLIYCVASSLTLIVIVSGSPTDKITEYDVTTTESPLFDATEVDIQTEFPSLDSSKQELKNVNTTFRQEEDDDESSEEEVKGNNEGNREPEYEGNRNPGFIPLRPGYLSPSEVAQLLPGNQGRPPSSAQLPSSTAKTIQKEPVVSSTSASAAASEQIISVSRIPIAPAKPTSSSGSNSVTHPQKYKITKVSPAASATGTTVKPLSFEEEWNLTDIFHTGPHGRADCSCGKVPFKVDNPDSAGINQYPWTVAIVKTGIFGGGRVHCGGTLINDKYVITTSNCMDGSYTDGLQVWLTAHNTFQTDNFLEQDRVLKRDVVEILMHPNYNRKTNDNDIALLKLSKPIDISISSYYVPICLPATESNYAGLTARMAGWGTGGISNGRIFSSRICKEDVPVISNDVCNRDTRHNGKVTSNMMCAGLLTPERKDSCLGDSGSSLMAAFGGRYSLIGVVSWSFQNRESYSPIVYSKVSGYSDWILHNTLDADWCGT